MSYTGRRGFVAYTPASFCQRRAADAARRKAKGKPDACPMCKAVVRKNSLKFHVVTMECQPGMKAYIQVEAKKDKYKYILCSEVRDSSDMAEKDMHRLVRAMEYLVKHVHEEQLQLPPDF